MKLTVYTSEESATWQLSGDPLRVQNANARAREHEASGRWAQVPGEPVWVGRFGAGTTLEAHAPSIAHDQRLGVVEWPAAGGVCVLSLRADGGRAMHVRRTADGVRLGLEADAGDAAVVLAWGADGLHARAALFPFLSGARSRAGLAAARSAQASGASSST
jgi:hypothetical protein